MKESANATTVISLRLTPDERQLIEEAAGKKGWKAANFLRVSALERAAQVLNLSRPTSFDFSASAKRFAEVLVAPRTVSLVDTELTTEAPYGPFREGPIRLPGGDRVLLHSMGLDHFRPAPLTREQVDELQNAMRLGGAEFVGELIVECRRLGNTANDPNLPPPIDPHNLEGSD